MIPSPTERAKTVVAPVVARMVGAPRFVRFRSCLPSSPGAPVMAAGARNSNGRAPGEGGPAMAGSRSKRGRHDQEIGGLDSRLVAGLTRGQASDGQREVPAAPSRPTPRCRACAVDQTKVPHYFGPYPNWANSPLTQPDATVVITGYGTGANG